MSQQSFFGPPSEALVRGGTHITVYLIPVFKGRLLVFDVSVREARGRWLPWDVLEFGGNPYEAASALADDWCDGAVSDLALADVMSFPVDGGGWELAIIFRAELTALPSGDDVRTPFVFEPGAYDAIGNFDPVDLERWVRHAMEVAREPGAPRAPLLF
jgi:hypothetical protein